MPEKSMYAIFTSIPFLGHLNPLIRQADELSRRGWRTAVASLSEARAAIEANGNGVAFIDLGPGGKLAERMREIEEEVSQEPNFIKGAWRIMEGVTALWTPLYDGLLRVLPADRPDVMIVDFATAAGFDAAAAL